MTSLRLLYLDQNAWIALAQGAWDKATYPDQHAALTRIIAAVQAGRITAPLSFTNIYETAKINDPVRRTHLAGVQCSISGGKVFRGRRRVLEETLSNFLAERFEIPRPAPAPYWFLSDLWFESAVEHPPAVYGFTVPDAVLATMRQDPGYALFSYLTAGDEAVRTEAVRRHSAGSTELLGRLETRRALIAGETFALRRRAYAAQLLIDELEGILAIARTLGLPWTMAADLGAPLAKRLILDVPVLNVERELVVRLEDQNRATNENDLPDMAAFTTVLPVVDLFVAEKPFVNLARQAGLGQHYSTTLLTEVSGLTDALLEGAGPAGPVRKSPR
jgi:hypothetical protein